MSERESMLLDMGLNPDDFAESKIDPEQFTLAQWPNAFKDFKYPSCPCAMCGHLCRWVVGFRHIPSDNLIYVGEDCADYLDSDNVVEKQMKQFKTKMKNEAEARAKEMKRLDKLNAFTNDHPRLVRVLLSPEIENDISFFIRSMHESLLTWGSLTEKQTAHTYKILDNREAEANKPKPEKMLESGRYVIEGEIKSIKNSASYFDGSLVRKILVEMDDGNRIFGTLPKSLYNAEPGNRIKLTGTVKPKDGDDHFGFFANPTNGVIFNG